MKSSNSLRESKEKVPDIREKTAWLVYCKTNKKLRPHCDLKYSLRFMTVVCDAQLHALKDNSSKLQFSSSHFTLSLHHIR